MPLLRLIRGLFTKFEPRTVNLGELGEATSDRYGYWIVRRPIELSGAQVGLCFKVDKTAPGDPEIAACQAVIDSWPVVWSSILAKLREDLEDDGPDGERQSFLDKARPIGLLFVDGFNLWEVQLEPDIYQGHIVSMLIKGSDCEDFRLDG